MGGKKISLLEDEQWPNAAFGFKLPIRPQSAALGIIDVQHYSIDAAGYLAGTLRPHSGELYENYARDVRSMIRKIQVLLKAFRAAKRRVLFTRHGMQVPDGSDLVPRRRNREESSLQVTRQKSRHLPAKGDAAYEIIRQVSPLSGELVLDKNTSSAFHTTPIDLFLRNMNIETLVLAGVAADQCVLATALDAADRGFHVIIAADACATVDRGSAEATQILFGRIWGYVMQTEAVIQWLKTGRLPAATPPKPHKRGRSAYNWAGE